MEFVNDTQILPSYLKNVFLITFPYINVTEDENNTLKVY